MVIDQLKNCVYRVSNRMLRNLIVRLSSPSHGTPEPLDFMSTSSNAEIDFLQPRRPFDEKAKFKLRHPTLG